MERNEHNATVAPISEWATHDLLSVWRLLGAAVRQSGSTGSVADGSVGDGSFDERDLRADAEMFAIELIRRGAI